MDREADSMGSWKGFDIPLEIVLLRWISSHCRLPATGCAIVETSRRERVHASYHQWELFYVLFMRDSLYSKACNRTTSADGMSLLQQILVLPTATWDGSWKSAGIKICRVTSRHLHAG
jgi:hypothetical protein